MLKNILKKIEDKTTINMKIKLVEAFLKDDSYNFIKMNRKTRKYRLVCIIINLKKVKIIIFKKRYDSYNQTI